MANSKISKVPFDIFNFSATNYRISNVDLNDYRNSGIYFANGGLTHSPSGNYGILIVIQENASVCRQIFFPQGGNNVYLRRYYTDAWLSWYAVNITEVT